MTENDLVQRLRDRAYGGLPDPLSEQAADEIERLRLTDAEREAIEAAIRSWPAIGVSRENVDSLRGLLERLSPPTT
jgi:transposase